MPSYLKLQNTMGSSYNVQMDDALNTKRVLAALGYYHVPDHGMTTYPDIQTFDAIKSFQRDHGLRPDGIMKPQGETATAIGNEVLMAGGPDGTSGLVHVDEYTQNRDGTQTTVTPHTRAAPGTGTGTTSSDKPRFSKDRDGYHRGDGLVAKDRPYPTLTLPIADGKIRGHDAGDFDSRRSRKDKSTNEEEYYQHNGVDILAEPGTPAMSAVDGVVTKISNATERDPSLKYIEVTTPDGYTVRHHYLEPGSDIKEGDQIRAGQPIGKVGSLKKAYPKNMPNHLHFEVYDQETPARNGETSIKGRKRIDAAPFLWW